jgi:hypothetical protein
LDLDNFGGGVRIRGSTFTNNLVQYASCSAATNMGTSTNAFTDNYSNFGTKSVMQVKSLISIVNHWYELRIMGNVFSYNTGTKGIIYLDLYPRTNAYTFVCGHNKFT